MSNKANLENIKEVRVPLEVVLGETSLRLEDLSSLGPGTILELNRECGAPALVKAADQIIAQGEVVVIDENFGLRITQVFDERS